MKVVVYIEPGLAHHEKFLVPFAESIRKANHVVEVVRDRIFRHADLIVFWGHRARNAGIRERQISAGRDYLVAEAAVFGEQLAMVSLGFNGSRGNAEYMIGDDPMKRIEALGLKCADWKVDKPSATVGESAAKAVKKLLGKGKIYLMGQVPNDSTLAGFDYDGFVNATIVAVGKKVVFRPHPRSKYLPKIKCAIDDGSLDDALKKAACVVTASSTVGVAAALAGVPVIAMDPRSMAYDVAGHDLDAIETPVVPDRENWLKMIAYSQWTPEELADGTAWKTLTKKFENIK